MVASNWHGRHVVVTGASRGIGRATAQELARRGARVTLVARSEDALKEFADRIDGFPFPLDLADFAGLNGAVDRIEAAAGPVDVLINNAAVGVVGNLTDHAAAEVAEAFAVNVVAPTELMRQALPRMVARGGSIACISSLAGYAAVRGTTLYGATKAGLMQLCSSVQRELRGTSAHLTLVVLGEIAGTEMMEHGRAHPSIGQFSRRMARLHVLPEITPHDVATAVANGLARRRDVVVLPRRAAPLCWMRELPSKVNDILAHGID